MDQRNDSGQAISGLCRAFQLTNDPKYMEACKSALRTFDHEIAEGGVRFVDEKGYVWYEEVAVNPPAHILNGFIFALFGIYDYYRVTKDTHALSLFNQGIRTLKDKLHLYDTGGIIRYDLLTKGQLFRFKVTPKHPEDEHPIDKVVLSVEGSLSTLDIGSEGDDSESLTGSFLWYQPEEAHQDWGKSYNLDGRTVRNYTNRAARYSHAAFRVALPKEMPWEAQDIELVAEVFYKDVSTEKVFLEIHDGERYHRLGQLENKNDGRWKTIRFSFPSSFLRFGGRLSEGYHGLVVKQLKGLYNITGDAFFSNMSSKWAERTR